MLGGAERAGETKQATAATEQTTSDTNSGGGVPCHMPAGYRRLPMRQKEQGVDDLIALAGAVDGILQGQAAALGNMTTPGQMNRIQAALAPIVESVKPQE